MKSITLQLGVFRGQDLQLRRDGSEKGGVLGCVTCEHSLVDAVSCAGSRLS